MKRILIITIAVLAVLGGVTVCKKSVSPAKDTKEVQEIKAMILTDEGNLIFDKTSTGNNVYHIGIKNKEDATKLVQMYADNDLEEAPYVRTLPEGKGTITVNKGPEKSSTFYIVLFEVEGIEHFTLEIKNAAGMARDGDIGTGHAGTYHKCNVCGFVWRSTSSTCPMTQKHASA